MLIYTLSIAKRMLPQNTFLFSQFDKSLPAMMAMNKRPRNENKNEMDFRKLAVLMLWIPSTNL